MKTNEKSAKNAKNAKNAVKNVQTVNEYVFTRTNGKAQTIHTIAEYSEFLATLKREPNFKAVAMAQKYTEFDRHSVTMTQKTNDSDVENDLQNTQAKFGEGSKWSVVWSAICEERANNTLYLITYNNELVVEEFDNELFPVVFYSARFVDIDATYDSNKRETASGEERIAHSKRFNLQTCESEELIAKRMEALNLEIAACKARMDFLNSDEHKEDLKIQEFAKTHKLQGQPKSVIQAMMKLLESK